MNEPVTGPYAPEEMQTPKVASDQALASTIVESGTSPAAAPRTAAARGDWCRVSTEGAGAMFSSVSLESMRAFNVRHAFG